FLIALALRRLARRSRSWLLAVSFVAALLNTVAAALGFVLEYAIGGQLAVSLSQVTFTMVGLHAPIGIGGGVITALTVGAVASARPDLVYLLRRRTTHAEAGQPEPTSVETGGLRT